MGSAKDPTKTAKTARVQPNTVTVADLPPASGQASAKDPSIVVPLININEGVWQQLSLGEGIAIARTGSGHLEAMRTGVYLGTVPPQYVETVMERQLFSGSCVVVGKVPSDLRVRLSTAE